MKIAEALTLSSLKDSFHRLVEEMKPHNEIEITTQSIDTAGIQFLLAVKKSRPSIKIHLSSAEAKELAKLLGAEKCL